MAERDNVIQILFGVAGGSSISGESGAQIKKDLESIASQIKVAVSIDDTGFKSQVQELKKYIQEEIGHVAVKVNIGKTNVTEKSGSGSSGSVNNIQKQSDAYKQLRHEITETTSVYKSLAKELDSTTKKYGALETKIKDAEGNTISWDDAVKSLTDKVNNSGLCEPQIQSLRDLITESKKTISVQKSLTKAMQDDKVLRSTQTSYKGLEANINRLRQQYSSLIKTNREAAQIMADLDRLVGEGFHGNEQYYDSEKNEWVAGSYESANQQITDLAQKSREAAANFARLEVETDTVGKRLRETFSSKIIQTFSYALIGFGVNALSQVYRNVVQLDSAITDLQIATGKTREETAALVKSYGELAQTLGSTISEVSSGADTWLRQGYSVAETNQLIADSMMLAKLGQLDAAEAAKALTSAMKGYGVSVNDAMGIVDKFTAVDMEAAVSAGGIATAMAETAAGAQLAGISMDRLIGQIALVAEVTQDGEESVGTFFRTLYARMGNIKVGKFVDDETGESLNDVEKVLGKLGIQLRDEQGLFRNFADVLDETAANWDNYTNVQQHAIATAFAGTRQQEKFIILMRDYGKALDYAAVAADSAGTAQEKFNAAYMDSIEAKINGLTAAWEKFSMTILDSDLVKGFVTVLTGLANALTALSEWSDGALIWIPAITAAVMALITAIQTAAKSQFIVELLGNGQRLINTLKVLGNSLVWLGAKAGQGVTSLLKLTSASTALGNAASTAGKSISTALSATNIVGWVAIAVTAIAGVVSAIKKANEAAEEARKKTKELADQARENTETIKEETNQLKELIDQYEDLAKSNADGLDYSAEVREKILDIQSQITELVGKEANGLELTNKKYEEQLELLAQIAKEQYKEQYDSAVGEVEAAILSANNVQTPGRQDGIQAHLGYDDYQFYFKYDYGDPDNEILQIGQAIIDSGILTEDTSYKHSGSDQSIYLGKFAEGAMGTSASRDNYIAFSLGNGDPEEMVDYLTSIINLIQEEDLLKGEQSVALYNTLIEYRDEYEEYLNNIDSARKEVLDAVVGLEGVEDVRDIGSLEEYKSFRETLINDVLSDNEINKLIESSHLSQDDVTEAVDDWLALYASKWFDAFNEEQSSAIITSKSFLDILNEIEGEFNALDDAVKSIEENGIVSADAIRELLEEYEGLEKYFQMTDQGYELGIKDPATGELWQSQDILEAYVKEYLQPYLDEVNNCEEGTEEWTTAVENYNNAIAVCATLLRAAQIESTEMWETEKENLEKDQDALEDQLDKYKEIIDLRKDLLETYEEELSYQKELKKKQENVASLQTQLAIARLDTSAAGQARVRELEQELEEAQEELDDFTL